MGDPRELARTKTDRGTVQTKMEHDTVAGGTGTGQEIGLNQEFPSSRTMFWASPGGTRNLT